MSEQKHVLIVGGGFAGLNVAKKLGNQKGIRVTLIDKRNHHLFQPLLYQVAMAGLSPAEIAVPIRSLLGKYKNIEVLQARMTGAHLSENCIETNIGKLKYDYLVLACGAESTYFGNERWEPHAPSLKTLSQATEIRRRVLAAFEEAERETDISKRKRYLTFVVVGGGPTGVELAGALGEMSRYTLSKDFKHINPKSTRIILVEMMDRILMPFDKKLSDKATRALEKLGVQVWTHSKVEEIDSKGIKIDDEFIETATVLWGAGVAPSKINKQLGIELTKRGFVPVQKDLSLKDYPNVMVLGDQAHFEDEDGQPLPGLAPVALQQGKHAAKNIIREVKGKTREPFSYFDKGQMATIGRSKAIAELGKLKLAGFMAWVTWLVIHILYLTGFRNKVFVILSWAWSYLKFTKGARLIVNKDWQVYDGRDADPDGIEDLNDQEERLGATVR